MMKIVLVRPTYGSRFQVTPPLSLGYLSSSLKLSGYNDVGLIDGSLYLYSPYEAVQKAVKDGIPSIIGIQVYTGSHKWTRDFVNNLRTKYPDVVVLVGGPHITALKSMALKFIGADYGVIGEGETSIVQFADYISGKIKDPCEVEGLIYKEGSDYKHAKILFGFLKDADRIPFPDWELLKPNKYFRYMEGATMPLRGRRPVPILTSRGCPFRCTFCSSGLTNKRIMRYRSPENIVLEIKYLKEKYGIDEIFIADDNLTLNIGRAEKLFDMIIEQDLNIHWRAPNGIRVDYLSPELIRKIRKSGGYYVGVGVESGNKRILKQIKKRLDLENVRKNVSALQREGIQVSGFFMCGMISETEKEIYDTINFALSTRFDRIQVSDYVPYPGSEDFETVFKSNSPQDYEDSIMKFQEKDEIPEFRELSWEDITSLQQLFIRRFYLRPQIIFSMLKTLNLRQIMAILRHPYIKRWFIRKKKWYAT